MTPMRRLVEDFKARGAPRFRKAPTLLITLLLLIVCLLPGKQSVSWAKELPESGVPTPSSPPAGHQRSARTAVPTNAAAVTPLPIIQAMMNQVSSVYLTQLVSELSGETSAVIGGSAFTLVSRYSRSASYIDKATQYAYEHFQAMGLPVAYQDWSSGSLSGRNVIAEQIGRNTACIYMLTAHIDDTSQNPTGSAPGADDNASGSAGVLAAAGILKNYHFNCTLRYAVFTGEEQGLYGSEAYAQAASARSDPIQGVLNLDMIAFNSPGTEATIELDVRPGSSGTQDKVISGELTGVLQAYGINLTPYIYETNEGGSDQDSFWASGFPAILAIEDWDDHTPDYHTTGYRLATLDMTFFTDFVRAALGTTAHLAGYQPTSAAIKSFIPLTSRNW